MPSPSPSQASDIAGLILALAREDATARETAAAEIFQRGCDLTASVCLKWLTNADLKSMFVHAARDKLHATVGVAVPPERFEGIRQANGTPPLADVPPDQDAVEFELDFPNEIRLDVLTTRDVNGNGAIAKYLQKFGAGIQQVEFLVTDVDKATAILRKGFGVQPIYPQTRRGANNTRVNFFLIPTPENKKVLIEFVEALP